jgi:hypothetical protein
MEVTRDLKRREFFYCLGELRNAADSVLGLEGYQEVTCSEVFRGIEDQLRGWLARCERFAMEEEDNAKDRGSSDSVCELCGRSGP